MTSRRFRAQVQADQRDAQQLGATGTPFIVIDRRVGIPGAVDVDTLVEALRRAWSPAQVSVGEGERCEPDGC